METATLLAERGKTHGDYTIHAKITQTFKAIAESFDEYKKLDPCQREAFDMIFHKMGRILAGNPHFNDHWADIAGYAKLVADRCLL